MRSLHISHFSAIVLMISGTDAKNIFCNTTMWNLCIWPFSALPLQNERNLACAYLINFHYLTHITRVKHRGHYKTDPRYSMHYVFSDVAKEACFDFIREWVGLWSFLWWAPSAKWKEHHGVSSGWSSTWFHLNTGLSSTQYEQIPIIFGVWPFWLTPFYFRFITFWWVYG